MHLKWADPILTLLLSESEEFSLAYLEKLSQFYIEKKELSLLCRCPKVDLECFALKLAPLSSNWLTLYQDNFIDSIINFSHFIFIEILLLIIVLVVLTILI